MASGMTSQNLVDWEISVPAGPALAFHTGGVINNCLYIHGGVSRYGKQNFGCNSTYGTLTDK